MDLLLAPVSPARGSLLPPLNPEPTQLGHGPAGSHLLPAGSGGPASLSDGSLFSPACLQPSYPYGDLFQMLGNLRSPAQHEKYFPDAYRPLEELVFSSLPAVTYS